jgi:hypothetical protein
MKLLHGFSSHPFVRYGGTGPAYLPSFQIAAASFPFDFLPYHDIVAGDILWRWTLGPIHIPLLLRLAEPYYKIGTSHLVERPEGIRNGWHDGLVAPICRCTGGTFQVGSPTG